MCGLNHVMQGNQVPFCVLSKDNSQFWPLLKTLDSLTSELHSNGIDVVQNNWTGTWDVVLGEGSTGLFNSKDFSAYYIFLCRANFVLRGGTRALRPSCIPVHPCAKMYTTNTENLFLKITNTDSKIINIRGKVVKGFTLPGNDCCIVKLL